MPDTVTAAAFTNACLSRWVFYLSSSFLLTLAIYWVLTAIDLQAAGTSQGDALTRENHPTQHSTINQTMQNSMILLPEKQSRTVTTAAIEAEVYMSRYRDNIDDAWNASLISGLFLSWNSYLVFTQCAHTNPRAGVIEPSIRSKPSFPILIPELPAVSKPEPPLPRRVEVTELMLVLSATNDEETYRRQYMTDNDMTVR